jgi:hypothetical protein
MDRHLAIALVSSALALLFGYGLGARVRRGNAQIQYKMIARESSPAMFWAAMIALAVVEVFFIVLTFTNFVAWLRTP